MKTISVQVEVSLFGVTVVTVVTVVVAVVPSMDRGHEETAPVQGHSKLVEHWSNTGQTPAKHWSTTVTGHEATATPKNCCSSAGCPARLTGWQGPFQRCTVTDKRKAECPPMTGSSWSWVGLFKPSLAFRLQVSTGGRGYC